MTAFFVATATIKNPEKVQDYARKAAETFAAYGGEFVVRGKLSTALVGPADHQAVAVVKFPSFDLDDASAMPIVKAGLEGVYRAGISGIEAAVKAV